MKRLSWVVAGVGAACVLLASKGASAQEEDTPASAFGRQGHLVIGSDAGFAAAEQSYSGQNMASVIVNPSVDYFVVEKLSIGLGGTFSYSHGTSGAYTSDNTSYGAGVKVGYDLPLGSHVSLWPRLMFAFETFHSTDSGPTSAGATAVTTTSDTSSESWAQLFVPVLFHPADHFFLGLGPYLQQQITGPLSNNTAYGVKFTLGGWL